MIAALLPVAALAAAAAEPAPAPHIAPPAGKTAVRATDSVTVSGAAGDMADGAVAAELVALGANGEMFRESVAGVSVSGGQYQGTVALGCGFGEPGPRRCSEVNPDADGLITGVVLDVAGAARSNTVRVDYVDPEIVRYELVDSQTVRVVFSEPVRPASGQQDNKITDWAVDGLQPVSVSDPKDAACSYDEGMTTGCTRLLALADPQSEDATPLVEYLPLLLALSPAYRDYADNGLAISDAERSDAIDRIRPAKPQIQTIDGTTPAGEEGEEVVVGNNNQPDASITNLLGGHTVRLEVQPDAGSPLPPVETTVPAGTNTVVMPLPTLPTDGSYTVAAVAIDAAGNRSDDDSKTGPGAPTELIARADGELPTAQYTLDRQAPEVLSAELTNTTTVVVELTEPLFPDGHAGNWFVGNTPVTATGSGAARTLESATQLDNPGQLRWEPTSTEPGSTGMYADEANNGMAALSALPLSGLPALAAPQITSPTSTTFSAADSVTITGTADADENLVADLFSRGSETALQSVPVSGGRWTIEQPLDQDGRFEYEVRIRSTWSGVFSQRARVPDVVRDTVAPTVTVEEPSASREYGRGETVTVRWVATDAADDARMPDHANSARVIMVSDTGTRRDVSGRLEVQPGQAQTFTYRLDDSDLEGSGFRDLQFEVVVDDLAGNAAADVSSVIRLVQDRIGYTPVLTGHAPSDAGSVIVARFPTDMTGAMLPTDWTADGASVVTTPAAEGSEVQLTVPLVTDPNATPAIKFTPTLPMDQRLRASANNRQVTEHAQATLDRIPPALDVQAPELPAVVDAREVTFSGQTDVTAYPNTIAAYAASAGGGREGPALAKTVATTDGTWKLAVPLAPNRLNRIVIQAIDPSGNVSDLRPSSPFTVTEDSIAPVVRIRFPRRATHLRQVRGIRWTTVEANPSHARLLYRARGGSWKTITSRTADDGYYRWTLPKGLNGRVFDMRVQAFDRTGKRRTAFVTGLRGDFTRPVVRRARAIGPYKVRLFLSEPVYMPRFGFTVDGIAVKRVVHKGPQQTLVLRRPLRRTTPVVRYSGRVSRDRAGNRLAPLKEQAERRFVFGVTSVRARRLSATRVRITWRDVRNRPAHVRHYRIYRDGRRIGTVRWSSRAFVDRHGRGTNIYRVRAFDNERRISATISKARVR